MLFKIALGISAAATMVAAFLFWQNGNLRDDISQLEFEKATLTANLRTQKTLAAQNAAAARVASEARTAAELRAKEAERIREAILEGNDEILNDLDGTTGAALRLLRQLGACGEREAGVTGHPSGPDDDLPEPRPGD